jgi:hypothetical protein
MFSRRVFSGLMVAIAAILVCGFASQAYAYTDPPLKLGVDPANLEATAEALVEGSPRKIEGISSGASSEAIRSRGRDLPGFRSRGDGRA